MSAGPGDRRKNTSSHSCRLQPGTDRKVQLGSDLKDILAGHLGVRWLRAPGKHTYPTQGHPTQGHPTQRTNFPLCTFDPVLKQPTVITGI